VKDNHLLQVEALCLQREGHQILHDVHFTMASGQVFGLIGRNGSGKSSLAYTLMGCAGYTPQQGHIVFTGQDITSLSITERARPGMTLAWQEPARFEGITVRDYLALGMQEPSQKYISGFGLMKMPSP